MELGPVDRITADAVGEPGDRVFYLQARAGGETGHRRRREATGAAARPPPSSSCSPTSNSRPAKAQARRRWRSRNRSNRGGAPGGSRSGYDQDATCSSWRSRSSSPTVEDDDPQSLLLGDPETVRLFATREQMFALSRHGAEVARTRPSHVPVLRQPHGPRRARMSRDERALEAGLSDPAVPPALARGELEILGLLPRSSNYTFLAARHRRRTATRTLGVYKPQRGEMPAVGLPGGHAVPSRGGGLRGGSRRWGGRTCRPRSCATAPRASARCSVRRVRSRGSTTSRCRNGSSRTSATWPLFDVVVNNADRKGGHCLLGEDGRIWLDRPRRVLQRASPSCGP